MVNTHCCMPIKMKSNLFCLAASSLLCRDDNSLRMFSCEDRKRNLDVFEYSFLSYLVFCFEPHGECRECMVFFLNFWQGEILHPVKMMINSSFCCEFPAGTAPKPGLSVRYTRLCSVAASAPSSPKGMDIVFSHNGELSIKMERHSAYRTHEVKHNRLLAGTEAPFSRAIYSKDTCCASFRVHRIHIFTAPLEKGSLFFATRGSVRAPGGSGSSTAVG